MKKILIVADGIFADSFLKRLFESKAAQHDYTIISQNQGKFDNKDNLENFNFHYFDPTSLSKLKSVADGYFSQFCIIMQNLNEAFEVYLNLRKISTKTNIVFTNIWHFDDEQKTIISSDKHLKIVDARDLVASRLINYIPDVPVLADNIGISEGEIMEVKVPIGSAYMYRHLNSIQQKKWRIALIYRTNEIILPSPSVMIHPNDTLLIVGDPKILQNVYRSIKREPGQFPSPFGNNIYTIIDMRVMSKERVKRLIENSLYTHSKLTNRRLIFKVLNPTLCENLNTLKMINDKNIVVLFDYFAKDNSKVKFEINMLDVGLLITDNEYFFKFKRLFYDVKLPILKTGVLKIEEIKQGVILGAGGDEIENQSAVIMDCCKQLDVDIKFYHFDTSGDKDALSEHFESLSNLFSKCIMIESSNEKNPLITLKNSKNLLQFVIFDEKFIRVDAFAFLSTDMNRLYRRLSKNAQLFVPVSI
ncbi:potassium transporter TrkA [Campylobacter sp. faydin G-140]|uniref:COG3400 family protein n=1 Tax=Campylobacter anatolicus TaxID=2829105 RepID=UPI001B8E5855|nr:TrkA C-terminal domain-containing protein [Campylobacter anatolicus]MBR8462803.1 potassium transporter TrkA [Campylobacter anatolicus]MBR8465935.1 potassium transporter TrkA [Campylobacter anatolicus]